MKDKTAQHVVTSENRAEFMAKRLDIVEPIKTENKLAEVSRETTENKSTDSNTSESEVTVNAETETTDDKKPENTEKVEKIEKKKPEKGIQERFSELTAQREAARAEAKAEREKREALERQLAEKQPKIEQKSDEKEPDPNDQKYKDDWRLYAKDLAKWETQKALAERDKQETERKQKEEADKVILHWTERQKSFKEETPDYLEVIGASTAVVSDEIRDAIIESDVGPQILYHLAKNPEVVEKLSGLSVRGALRELGKLEARLENPPKKQEESVKTESKREAQISKAPAPINPLKGANNPPEVPIDSEGNFKGTPKEWRELRKAGKIK